MAAEVDAGLIVVGRREAARDGRAEIGSVAGHLIRCASRPALLVPPDFTRLDVEAFRRNEPCTRRKAP